MTPSARRFASACVLTLAAFPLAAHADSKEQEFAVLLERLNKTCSSQIKATTDFAAWGKDNPAWACTPIFNEVDKACRKDKSFDVHPAGRDWVKENIKTITCAPGAAGASPPIKIALAAGVLTFVPDRSRNTETETEREIAKTWGKGDLGLKVRVWDLKQELDEGAKKVNEACGSKVTAEADLPSWHGGGYARSYPDLAVGAVCTGHLDALLKACKDGNQAAIVKGVQKYVCRYGGKEMNSAAKPSEAKLAGGTLTVVTGDISDMSEWGRTHEVLKEALKLKGDY